MPRRNFRRTQTILAWAPDPREHVFVDSFGVDGELIRSMHFAADGDEAWRGSGSTD